LVHEGGWREVIGLDGRTVLLRPDGTRQVGPTPTIEAAPVSPAALVDANRERGIQPPSPDARSSLGGHGRGERLTSWGMSLIIESLLAASGGGAELADLDAADNVDDLIGSGPGPAVRPSG
jgi:hypothetical protein